ncbi:MAG: VCBS repeat-containing protein [Planctomycetaceae bacterium]|nr:VCBS repeat-containing protein [Planctomycetaceae bacterium]
MWNWLPRPWQSSSRRVRQRHRIRVERLEIRELLSANIVFDYTYDTSGFFNNYERRATMEAAAKLFEDAITDSLTAITPGGPNTWSIGFDHPSTGAQVTLSNPTIPADEIRVYLGARDLAGGTIGFASTSWSAGGTSAWLNTVEYRGQPVSSTEFAVWGGSITFDSLEAWHTGVTETGLDSGESDLYSTAIHELAHLLGFGGDSWYAQISGGAFTGPNARAANGNLNPPVTGGHLAEGLQNDGREVSMSPVGTAGIRAPFTTLDWAVLDDLGWTFAQDTAPNGHLVVQVVDLNGDPVSGAAVTGSRAGGGTVSGTTDADGLFTTFVADGTWTIAAVGVQSDVTVTKAMQGVRLSEQAPAPPTDDVFLWDATTGRWWLGLSDGTSFTETLANRWSTTAGYELYHGDFNGDGQIDIAGRQSSGYWWVGLSDGTKFVTTSAWGRWDPGAGWQDVHVGDFNGDGKDDIAGRDSAGFWWIAFSDGSSFTTSYAGRWSETGWTDVVFGDFNNDGRTDVAGRKTAGYWYLALSNGSTFSNVYAGRWSPNATWQHVLVGDFDGNGTDDIAGQNAIDGIWYIGLSDGTSLTTAYAGRWSTTAGYTDVVVGDFTGDGKADIAGRNANGAWWVNISQGSTFLTRYWGAWWNDVSWDVAVGDYDGDGRDDIAGFVASRGTWYVAQSSGTSFSNQLFARWSTDRNVGYVGTGMID